MDSVLVECEVQGSLRRIGRDKVSKCLGLDHGSIHRARTTSVYFVGNREPVRLCEGII